MTGVLAVLCGVLGLAVGSFLNVVIYRVPRRESVVSPRSRCPRCDTQLSNRDNIPLISWLVLRGRCRTCGEPISVTYPIVEAATAALFVVAAVRFGTHLVLVPYLLFFAVLLAVSVIDIEHLRIPDRIVFPALGASMVLIVVVSLVEDLPAAIGYAITGSIVYFVLLFVPHLLYPKGMGFGDVKFALVMGLYVGWLACSAFAAAYAVLIALVIGCALGAVLGIGVMVLQRRGRREPFPFGPALAASALLVVLLFNHLPINEFC